MRHIFYLVENEAQNFAPQTFPTILVWFLRQYSFDFRAYVHCLNRALYALCTRLFILIADWVAHFAIVYSCPTICCVCASLLHVYRVCEVVVCCCFLLCHFVSDRFNRKIEMIVLVCCGPDSIMFDFALFDTTFLSLGQLIFSTALFLITFSAGTPSPYDPSWETKGSSFLI
jgi:hypothetical protein